MVGYGAPAQIVLHGQDGKREKDPMKQKKRERKLLLLLLLREEKEWHKKMGKGKLPKKRKKGRMGRKKEKFDVINLQKGFHTH